MTVVEVPCLDSTLFAEARFVGGDLWVLVSGGPAPHVGSVCLGVPRPSLDGSGKTSATVSTLNATGHKDDAVGGYFAARLASAFNCLVSVSCGIHFEHPTPDDLRRILHDAEALLDTLVAVLANGNGDQNTA